MLNQQAPAVPILNRAIVFDNGSLYSPPVFALVWQCFYLSLVPTFTGASAAVASIWHQRHLAVILHTDQTFFYCINQFVKCQDWILE